MRTLHVSLAVLACATAAACHQRQAAADCAGMTTPVAWWRGTTPATERDASATTGTAVVRVATGRERAAVPHAQVELASETRSGRPMETDADGSVSYRDLVPGLYRVSVRWSGQSIEPVWTDTLRVHAGATDSITVARAQMPQCGR